MGRFTVFFRDIAPQAFSLMNITTKCLNMKVNNNSPRALLLGRPGGSAGSTWFGRLIRGKQNLCFGLVIFMIGALNAQHSPPYQAYLEEKVRDPQIREFLEKHLEGTATQEDLRAFQAYYHDRHNDASRANELI